jgi:phage gpG-like protein
MADIGIKINMNGANELTVKLDGVESRSQNLSIPLKRAGQLMLYSINQNFLESGRPNSWAPLSSSTLKQKVRNGYSSQPLIRGGILKGSIHYRTSSTRLTLGTSVKYAAIHQFGGVINQGARNELFQRNRYLRGIRAGSFKRGIKLSGPNRVGFGFRARGFSMGARTINIPARPFVLFQDQDIDDINKMVKDYIIGIR